MDRTVPSFRIVLAMKEKRLDVTETAPIDSGITGIE
jgi:hypothetical protein